MNIIITLNILKRINLLSNKIKNKEIKTLLNVSHNKQKKYNFK